MYKFTLVIAMALILPLLSFAQEQRTCGSMDHLEMMMEQYPQAITNMEAIENHTRNFIANGTSSRAVVTIPVVVHVVYNTSGENISDAQVLSQIDVLNDDFRRTNADADNTWSQAADTEIEFCMATVDPSGNPTNGINRVSTGKRSFRTNDDVKKSAKGGVNPWDGSQYLNIWVCNLANGILGYAQFPGGSLATDGVVCLYNAFGTADQDDGSFVLNGSYNLGRTTTHEVGHWLNLRHIWGDGGCSASDFVNDTPDSDGANYDCATTSSCGSVDMHQNYMDYSYDYCMNLFTAGQSDRMNAVLAPGGFHYSLTQSTVCGGGGTDPVLGCTDPNADNYNPDATEDDGSCSYAPGSCDAPTGLSYSSKQRGRRATLAWNAVSGATSYTVTLSGASATTTSSTSATYSGLTSGDTYTWTVTANCASGSSDASSATFTAGTSNRGIGAQDALSVYPSPASDFITVEYAFDAGNELKVIENTMVNVSVVNFFGQVIRNVEMNDVDGGFVFDVNDINPGMYMMIVEQDGQQLAKKFIVE